MPAKRILRCVECIWPCYWYEQIIPAKSCYFRKREIATGRDLPIASSQWFTITRLIRVSSMNAWGMTAKDHNNNLIPIASFAYCSNSLYHCFCPTCPQRRIIAKVSSITLICASTGIAKHIAALYPCLQFQSSKEKKITEKIEPLLPYFCRRCQLE